MTFQGTLSSVGICVDLLGKNCMVYPYSELPLPLLNAMSLPLRVC